MNPAQNPQISGFQISIVFLPKTWSLFRTDALCLSFCCWGYLLFTLPPYSIHSLRLAIIGDRSDRSEAPSSRGQVVVGLTTIVGHAEHDYAPRLCPPHPHLVCVGFTDFTEASLRKTLPPVLPRLQSLHVHWNAAITDAFLVWVGQAAPRLEVILIFRYHLEFC